MNFDYWLEETRWSGLFKIEFLQIKDVPLKLFDSILLDLPTKKSSISYHRREISYEDQDFRKRPIYEARDGYEFKTEDAKKFMKIYLEHESGESIFDSFIEMDRKEVQKIRPGKNEIQKIVKKMKKHGVFEIALKKNKFKKNDYLRDSERIVFSDGYGKGKNQFKMNSDNFKMNLLNNSFAKFGTGPNRNMNYNNISKSSNPMNFVKNQNSDYHQNFNPNPMHFNNPNFQAQQVLMQNLDFQKKSIDKAGLEINGGHQNNFVNNNFMPMMMIPGSNYLTYMAYQNQPKMGFPGLVPEDISILKNPEKGMIQKNQDKQKIQNKKDDANRNQNQKLQQNKKIVKNNQPQIKNPPNPITQKLESKETSKSQDSDLSLNISLDSLQSSTSSLISELDSLHISETSFGGRSFNDSDMIEMRKNILRMNQEKEFADKIENFGMNRRKFNEQYPRDGEKSIHGNSYIYGKTKNPNDSQRNSNYNFDGGDSYMDSFEDN